MRRTEFLKGRTVKNTIKNPASKIEEFKKQFETLQKDCMQGATVHAAVVTFRVLDVANEIRT